MIWKATGFETLRPTSQRYRPLGERLPRKRDTDKQTPVILPKRSPYADQVISGLKFFEPKLVSSFGGIAIDATAKVNSPNGTITDKNT